MSKVIMLANPRGFCAGVKRAIEVLNILLAKHGLPIYVKHELVHNNRIIDEFKARGVIFIENPEEVPRGSILVFSAHGVSLDVRKAAKKRGLIIHDATCPLVTKVHAQVLKMRKAGCEIIIIGHANHPEVEGTMGQIDGGITLVQDEKDARNILVTDPENLAYVTQTTLSVDETEQMLAILRDRFPRIKGPAKEDICYATQNRQDAVKTLAKVSNLILVVGSNNSSNSRRLKEITVKSGIRAELIDKAEQINPAWLDKVSKIGVTAGASAPEKIVSEVITYLHNMYPNTVVKEMDGFQETVSFSVPSSLKASKVNSTTVVPKISRFTS